MCTQMWPAGVYHPVAIVTGSEVGMLQKKKKPILAPCWDHFFDLLFIAFVIIIIQYDWPQKLLPLYQTVKLKCLCSEPCPPVDSRKEEIINTSPA